MKSFFSSSDENLKWTTLSVKELLKTFIYTVTEKTQQAFNGQTGKFYVINSNDWVIVIPRQNGKLLMVKQWRHGENSLSIEFPGGVIDKGETPEQAAARELLEETGCKALKFTKLGFCNPNPALFSNHIHVFLAEQLIQTGEQHLDHDEFINLLELPEEQLLECIHRPEFSHALMGTAVAFYLSHKKGGVIKITSV